MTFEENVTVISGNLELVRNEAGLDFAKNKFSVLTACLFVVEMKLNFKVILKKPQKTPACRYKLFHLYLA